MHLSKLTVYLVAICIAIGINKSYAQPDSLANLPFKKRWHMVAPFYASGAAAKDTAATLQYINSVKQVAIKTGDKALLNEADLMLAYFYYLWARQRPEYAESFYNQVQKDIDKYPDEYVHSRLEDLWGSWNWEVKRNSELAFEHWYKALDIYRRLPEPDLDIRLCLQKVYDCHYEFGNYHEAIAALKEALAVTSLPPTEYVLIHGNNTLGLCYLQLNLLDSAEYFFKRTYAVADSLKNQDWKAIASGNLGNILFLRNQYAQAVPLLQYDVDMSVKRNDWSCASGSQTILADIMVRQNNLTAALTELNKARQYVYMSGQYRRLKQLYPLLSKYYAATGNAKLAMVYLDSAGYVNDSLSRSFSAMQLLKARQKIDLEKRNAAVAELEGQKRVKIIERNVLIGFVLLLLMVSLYVYRNQRRKHLHKHELLNLQLKEKQAELALANTQLENFASNISEKNKLLETLQRQFGEESNNEALLQLQQSTILTDEEWEKFRLVFEKVHGGYLNRLRDKLPGLSPAETRYMALAKLKLTNKEMAATLGVSPQAIRVTTFRLRKKLQLPEDGGLDELVASI